GGARRFENVRVVQFSVQGNHVHLLVEAEHTSVFMSAMKGLSVRIAKGMNRMMERKGGQVIGDRYHSRALRTPTEVRRVMHYIRDNHRQHMADVGERLPKGWVDPYCSDAPELAATLRKPTTWLVQEGWRRGRAGPPAPK